jgi:hypothetical protein
MGPNGNCFQGKNLCGASGLSQPNTDPSLSKSSKPSQTIPKPPAHDLAVSYVPSFGIRRADLPEATEFTDLNARHLVAYSASLWSDERLLGYKLRSKQRERILRNFNVKHSESDTQHTRCPDSVIEETTIYCPIIGPHSHQPIASENQHSLPPSAMSAQKWNRWIPAPLGSIRTQRGPLPYGSNLASQPVSSAKGSEYPLGRKSPPRQSQEYVPQESYGYRPTIIGLEDPHGRVESVAQSAVPRYHGSSRLSTTASR